jgi:hypothetical protein
VKGSFYNTVASSWMCFVGWDTAKVAVEAGFLSEKVPKLRFRNYKS